MTITRWLAPCATRVSTRGAPARLATLVVLALAGTGIWTAPAGAQGEGEVGIPLGMVPEPVVIEDLDGEAVDLSMIVGTRPVLLEFWATWCEVCKALEPKMTAAHERYGDRVDFIAVAVAVNQSKRSIRRHLDGHDLPFRFLYDTRGRATRAYMAPTTSYIVMLDAEGRVAYTGVGEEQDLEGALARLMNDE